MIYALGYYTNGKLNHIDYREFIKTNSLSQEHLISAKHFLQRESIFENEIERKLSKWYHEFTHVEKISDHQKNYFDNRHGFADISVNESKKRDAIYLEFMEDQILPKIISFQNIVREDIRFKMKIRFIMY